MLAADAGHNLFEHLVLDAVSTDETLAIARRFSHVVVTSSPDQGLYDAMNQGAQRARGKFLVFLQADDWLMPGALVKVAEILRENPLAQIVNCGAEAVRKTSSGSFETVWRCMRPEDRNLSLSQIALGEPMLNARIFSRKLFLESGGFNISLKLASDRDFLMRLARNAIPSVSPELLFYRYRWHSGSRTMNEGNSLSLQLTRENLQIAETFLRDKSLSRDQRAALLLWHRKQSVQLGMMAIEAYDLALFAEAFRRGCRQSRSWPSFLLGEFLYRLPAFLLRGCRTRSRVLADGKTSKD